MWSGIVPDLFLQSLVWQLECFFFATIETMQESVRVATETTANDTTLIVYRENRFCPSTSTLPEYYKEEIEKIDGVENVIPLQIRVNNCGTSLNVVKFLEEFQRIKLTLSRMTWF